MTVLDLVRRERVRVRSKLTLAFAAMAAAGIAVALAVGVVILGGSRWISLPRSIPFIFWLLAGATLVFALVQIIRLGRSVLTSTAVASRIERERSLRDGSLRGILEVAESGALARKGAELMAASLGAHSRRALAPQMQRSAQIRALAGAVAALLAAVALTAARGTTPDGWKALTHPVSAWNGTLASPLEIDAPGAVMRGEKVEIIIAAAARRRVRLYHRATGSAWRDAEYRVGDDENARAVLGPVDADVMLVAGDGRTMSDTVVLRVTDRPFVGDVAIRASYPKYLDRANETLPVGEPVVIPRGTVLDISGHASVALAQVSLVSDEGDTLTLDVDGHRFRGRVTPSAAAQWSWHAQGQVVRIHDVPPPLDIRVIPDSAPSARIMWPANDTLLAPSEKLDLELVASDDHSIQSVILRSWKRARNGQLSGEQTTTLARDAGASWTGESRIDLAERQLDPGDELHIVLLATDGSPWSQLGASRELTIRIPTSSEQRALARQAADSAVANARSAAAAQRELEKKTSDASRSQDRSATAAQSGAASGDKSDMSYGAAEQARALAGAQRDIEKQIEDLRRSASEMEDQLRQAGALDSGLATRLAEARQLLNQAMTPELREHMRKLEEAAQQLSQSQAKQAMTDLAEQQRKLRDQLEKSAEMLKRAAFEGAMQTLSDEARELAAKEKALADSLAKGMNPSRESEELKQRSEALKSEMEELAKKLSEANANPGAQRTQEAAKQTQASLDALSKIDSSRQGGQARSGGQGQQQGRGQQQQSQQQQAQGQQAQQQAAADAAQAMQRAADEMQNARNDQIQEWKSEVTRELDRAVQEMQQLARRQEQLEQQARQGTSPGSLRGEQTAVQQGVQRVNERLQQTTQKSSLLSPQSQRATSEAQNRAQQATQQTAGAQSGSQAADAMRESARAMQQAAASLARDRERVNAAKSASGFSEMIEQMQQLAQQQGGLSAMSQGLLQNSASMSSQQVNSQAAEIARQQRELARRMEELADATGRSEALANEARRIAAALESGIVDQATVLRQQQLFRRMLDAGRTLEQEERDSTGRRESRSATGDDRFVPRDNSVKGTPALRFKEPGWDELRGLTADERRAVLEYFRKINGGGSQR